MRQAVMSAAGVVEMREVGKPQPGPGEVLLRIQRIGICGSDVHVYHGKHPFAPFPVIQGHEFSAVVEAVGEGLETVHIGEQVTATPQEVCGTCAPCRRGDWHICDELKVRGFQAPGVAQDFYVTQVERIVPLPDNFAPEQGALVEPIAVAVHATARAGNLQGRNVVVLGAGPIGNLMAQVARAQGGNVLISDLSEYRLEKARDCGIEHTLNPNDESLADAALRAFGTEGFNLALDCAGVPASIGTAVDAIGKGGTILVVAVFGEQPPIDMSVVCEHELTIRGTMMYQHGDWIEAVKMIAEGKVATEPLVTNHFPFEQYLDAYQYIDVQGDKTLKVMIDL
ncbi:MAG: alcohol dehydrogenase catalytic domain-containing protein [Nitrospiraceae bacterium]|nr:alcohol dehydrogenase catalytic domain-containing protein [Nitrospiraceae bacterium]